MAITLTEKAAQHVQKYLTRRGKGLGLRLGVRTTGCSGLAYKLEYVDELTPEDQMFESHGVKVFVDPKSLAYIDGTELDFARGVERGVQVQQSERKGRVRLRRIVPRVTALRAGRARGGAGRLFNGRHFGRRAAVDNELSARATTRWFR